MPPRVSPRYSSATICCQCLRTRSQAFSPPAFSYASRRYYKRGPPTELEQEMHEWLYDGPGRVFQKSVPGSTNYMSAYDKYGKLLRTARRGKRDTENVTETEEVIPVEAEAEVQRQEEEEGLDEEERQTRFEQRAAARERKAEVENRGGLPKERPSDLRPFPLNHQFRSQPVLSENLREEIYRQVVEKKMEISTVSAAFSVDLRRVAAVVRLKTIEKQWLEEGKSLAAPYNDAVMAMLPQTPFRPYDTKQQVFPHETINDLPVHPHTRQQIFYPVSESRHFTREDAARAFNEKLLPADKRIPHPELIALEKDNMAGYSREQRYARLRELDAAARKQKEEAAGRKWNLEERTTRVVPGRRWGFRFQDINAEKVGKDGRGRDAVGARYGMPHEDRKKGIVKIPMSVE